jgi:DNA (cytosine-5)-methyltransferase 1
MFTLQSRHQHAIAFNCKQSGNDAGEVSPPLRAMGHDKSHANGGGQIAVAFRASGQEHFVPREVSPPIASTDGGGAGVPTIFQSANAENLLPVTEPSEERERMGVRMLTVIECHRLMGLRDTYLFIPLKKRKIKSDMASYYLSHGLECWQEKENWYTKIPSDAPMYKALGNSMVIPVLQYLGERIRFVDRLLKG